MSPQTPNTATPTSNPSTVLDGRWVAEVLQGAWTGEVPQGFTGVCFDSRNLKAGELFVALKGARHGHEFVATALQKGAAGAIVEALQPVSLPQIVVPDSLAALQTIAAAWRRNWGAKPERKLCGVTGSSGKTSAKELLAHLLGPTTHKTIGNFNNHIGLPVTLLALPSTATHAVVEAGVGGPGEMDILASTSAPDAALLTIIGSAHLEFFKSPAAIAMEKGKLLAAVPTTGLVVLHASELRHAPLQNLRAHVLALGQKPTGVATPANFEFLKFTAVESVSGWKLTLRGESYALPLWTPGMMRNAALAITLAREWGVAANLVQERLISWPGVSLRGLWMTFKGAPASSRIYFDAYNSNPEALADSLWRFHRLADDKSPRWYIIGTMGELGTESPTLHRESAAKITLRATDIAWTIGTQAADLSTGLLQAGATPTQIKTAATLEDIRAHLLTFPGLVFIKGSHGTGLHTLAADCSAVV